MKQCLAIREFTIYSCLICILSQRWENIRYNTSGNSYYNTAVPQKLNCVLDKLKRLKHKYCCLNKNEKRWEVCKSDGDKKVVFNKLKNKMKIIRFVFNSFIIQIVLPKNTLYDLITLIYSFFTANYI